MNNVKICSNCRYWSDKLAQSIGHGLQAYCLSQAGPLKQGYTGARQTCDFWQDAPLGAIDSGSDSDPRYGNPYEDDPQ